MNFLIRYAKTNTSCYLKAFNEKDAKDFCSNGDYIFIARLYGRQPRYLNWLSTDLYFEKAHI